MRKIFLGLLLLAFGLLASPVEVMAQAWAPIDTLVDEGYYRIYFKQRTPNSAGNVGDSVWVLTEYEKVGGTAGYMGIGVVSRNTIGDYDLQAIWHITKAGKFRNSQTYHLRNCREDGYNWWFPVSPDIGQSNQILGSTIEQDSIIFRLQDWGSSKDDCGGNAGIDAGGVGKCTRKDYPTQLVEGETGMFMVPTSSVWRFRVGNNSNVLVKLNSYSGREGATFYLEKLDLGDREAWMRLVETTSEARGMLLNYGTEAGDNIGKITSQTALNVFIKAIEESQDLIDEGATPAQYDEMNQKMKDAIAEVKKYVYEMPEDAYVAVYDWYRPSYPGGLYKWFAPFYDMKTRMRLSGSGSYPGSANTEQVLGRQCNISWWAGGWLLGYDLVFDATLDNLPQQYIWHIKSVEGRPGVYTMKNCAESSYSGDSTYFCPLWLGPYDRNPTDAGIRLKITASGYEVTDTYQRHNAMLGTPKSNVFFRHREGNLYWICPTQNPNWFNQGVNNLCTTNPLNGMTYATWAFQTVPESRITPKFKLNEAITEAGGIFIDWTPSVNPGQLKMSIAEPLQKALAEAREVYAKEGASDAEYTAAEEALVKITNETKELLKDTANALNPLEEGYYHIVGTSNMFAFYHGDARFNDGQRPMYDSVHVKCNMYADGENVLKWQLYQDRTNPNELWKISKMDDGKWSIQNVGTGRYIDGIDVGSTKIPLVLDPVGQTLTQDIKGTDVNPHIYDRWKTNGRWAIYGPYNSDKPYQYMNHSNGAGDGSIVAITKSEWSATHYLEKETDIKLLDSLIEVGAQKARNLEVLSAYVAADNAIGKTVAYTFNPADSLLYEAGAVYGLKDVDGNDSIGYDITKNQFNSNNKAWNEGTYRSLIDGDPGTYFHTRYSAAGGPQITDYSYLQVDLRDKPQKSFCFKFNVRGESNLLYGNYGGAPTTYGRTDYGQNYRPLDIVVYGANDTIEGTEWTEVRHITDIPTHQNFRTYWSPLIESETAYRYYRFEVPSTFGNNLLNGIPYWACGDFQVYPAVANDAKSSSVYNSELGAAVAELKGYVAQGKTEQAAEKVTQETLDKIYAAAAKVQSLAPDSMQLVGRILDAQVLADSSYVEDNVEDQQYGDVTAAQKSVLEAAIAKAKGVLGTNFSQADLDAAYNDLDAAFWTLNGQRKTFEVGKWYYMVSPETYSYHAPAGHYSWRGGHLIYACGNGAQPWIEDGKLGNTVEPIRWGHYTGFKDQLEGQTYPINLAGASYLGAAANWDSYTGGKIDCPRNPYAMWRIVKIEGEDSLYAIQNRATGLYVGRRRDYRTEAVDKSNGITQSLEPLKVQLNLVGRNQYEAIPVDSAQIAYYTSTENALKDVKSYADFGVPLHQQGSDFLMVWWGTGTERGFNTGSAIEFRPVDDPEQDVDFPAEDNSIVIKAFPFDIDLDEVLSDGASDLNFYAVNKVTTDNTDPENPVSSVELVGIEGEVKAGTPFIIEVGESANYVEGASDSVNLWVTIPELAADGYDLTSKTGNGMVSVMYGDSVLKAGIGFFANSVVNVTNDSVKVWIGGQSGYISPKDVVNDPSKVADKEINNIQGTLDGIKAFRATRSGETVDVYSIDGKLIKRQAKGGEATKGLSKGLYIIGKTKVYVQ